MSAFFSIKYPDRVCLLTDAAWLDGNGTMVTMASKVHVITGLPIALSVRSGNLTTLLKILEAFNTIEAKTVDAWLAQVPRVAKGFTPSPGDDHEMIVAAWSETRGPAHFCFVTHRKWEAAGVKPYQLVEMPQREFGAGADITAADLAGIQGDPHSPDFPKLHGADLFEIMRRKPTEWRGKTGHFIGGWVDLTTITAAGATMEILREWPDFPDYPIDPTRQWNENIEEVATWVQ